MTKTETVGRPLASLPHWVPAAARHYLVHTVTGRSIRELARGAGCHASTVLRQVRRFESLRDDPLVDEALRRLGASHFADFSDRPTRGHPDMTAAFTPPETPTEETLEREARRVLRRLNEPGACLAIAQDMEKGVVVRDSADGRTVRTAVLDREIAEAMALKDWIRCQSAGPDRALSDHAGGPRRAQAPHRGGRGRAGRVRGGNDAFRRPAPRVRCRRPASRRPLQHRREPA